VYLPFVLLCAIWIEAYNSRWQMLYAAIQEDQKVSGPHFGLLDWWPLAPPVPDPAVWYVAM
jgi:hypothetical protein